jgi:hypothetical protein
VEAHLRKVGVTVITAGGERELARDGLFTRIFVDAIDGAAAGDDPYVTFGEVAVYVEQEVHRENRGQLPRYGWLRGEGQIVFRRGAAPVRPRMEPAAAAELTARLREARKQFDRQYIDFDDMVSDKRSLGAYQGAGRLSLEGAFFYERVGRSDLAAAYRRTELLKYGSVVAGSLLAAAGLAWIIAGIAAAPTCDIFALSFDEYDACSGRRNGAIGGAVLGGLLTGAAGGAVAIWAGVAIDPHPVARWEAKHMGEKHNEALRKELGLPNERTDRAHPPALRIGLAGSF